MSVQQPIVWLSLVRARMWNITGFTDLYLTAHVIYWLPLLLDQFEYLFEEFRLIVNCGVSVLPYYSL